MLGAETKWIKRDMLLKDILQKQNQERQSKE
jgi:hypothetical protein